MGKAEPAFKEFSLILSDLNGKFSRNLGESVAHERDLLACTDVKARAFPKLGEILSKRNGTTETQRETTCIFDEIFVDLVCSLYFSACSLDRPSEMLLRRVLELGIAATYLWDMPHVFWGWKEHDEDLSFAEMLQHLNSDRYTTLVSKENSSFVGGRLIDAGRANEIYGSLSDTVHGKITTFESIVNDRFNFDLSDWVKHLKSVDEVESILLNLYLNRFHRLRDEITSIFPQITRYL